jgi:hypothetical protein
MRNLCSTLAVVVRNVPEVSLGDKPLILTEQLWWTPEFQVHRVWVGDSRFDCGGGSSRRPPSGTLVRPQKLRGGPASPDGQGRKPVGGCLLVDRITTRALVGCL